MTTTPERPVPPGAAPAAAPPSDAAARGGQDSRSVRPLLIRLHFYAAVLAAPFLLVAAISGGLYALSPQLEQVVHHDELSTDTRGTALPLTEQIAAAREVEPDLPLLAVRPADGAGSTTRVLFDDGRTEDSRRLAVFVDPVEAEVRGALTAYGGSGALPVRTWIDELHRNLHLGEPGRLYSELAASWLGVVAVAGVVLWWTGRRPGPRLRPSSAGGARRRTLSWHGALGTWAVLGFVMLSVTGLTWSTYAGTHVAELRTAAGWATPQVVAETSTEDSGVPAAGHHDGAPAEVAGTGDSPGVGYQSVLEAARAHGLSGPVEVTGPASGSGTYVVSQLDSTWPTRGDVTSVDPRTGQVVDTVRFADIPFVAKLASWGIDLHMGVLFGPVSQVAMFLLAATLVAMIVTGYRMWWQRRPTRGRVARMGRPVRRGAWRSLPPATTALLVVLVAVVGWFLPLLGISLVLFLAVDLLLAALGGRGRPEVEDLEGLGRQDSEVSS